MALDELDFSCMTSTGKLMNVAIIVSAILAMANGQLSFVAVNPLLAVLTAGLFFATFALGWAIKNRMFLYFYRPGLPIKGLLIASCGWIIFAAIEVMAGGANIRVDLLITLPVMIVISSTSLIKTICGLLSEA